MLHSRGADFFFSRLKNDVFGHKSDTLCSSRADPILAFRELTSVSKKNTHFMLHSRGPDFSYQHLKIHVFGHKIDPLCSTRVDTILVFRALKSVLKVIN